MKERFLLEDDKGYLETIIPTMRREAENPNGSDASRKVAKTVLERSIALLAKTDKELARCDLTKTITIKHFSLDKNRGEG